MSRSDIRIQTKEDVIALARADMPFFSEYALGYAGNYQLWKPQVEWQERAQASYLAKLRDPVNGRNLCILAPSEHGKTYGINVPMILWALSDDRRRFMPPEHRGPSGGRNLRIGICGSQEESAEAIGMVIDRLFKTRGRRLAEFGLRPGWPWNARQKNLIRDDDKLLHPSIFCFGPKTDVQGKRFDLLLMADVFTIKNQKTYDSRKNFMEWLDEEVIDRLEDWGWILADGHHCNESDNYFKLEENEEEWEVIKYKAVIEDPQPANGMTAKVLVPHKWSYEKLAKKRAKRPGEFQTTMQNNPTAKSTTLQRSAFDQSLNPARSLMTNLSPVYHKAFKRIRMELDPAFTINRRSAFSACLIWGVTEEGRKSLLGGWKLKLLPVQLRSKICQTFFAFEPDALYIEANAAQIFLVQNVREKLGPQRSKRIYPVYTADRNDPEETIEHTVSLMVEDINNGMVDFPYMDQAAKELAEDLFSQIQRFPDKPNDIVMAWHVGEQGDREDGKLHRRTIPMIQGLTRAVAVRRHPGRGIPRQGWFDRYTEQKNKEMRAQ